jgi:hypothetical protein
MSDVRWQLLAAIVVAYALAMHAWALFFWCSIEPKLRTKLGRRWQIEIVWQQTDRGRAWGIRGPENGRASAVAGVSLVVWLWGFFLPQMAVVAILACGWVEASIGRILLFETFALTPFTAARAMAQS